MTDPGFHDSRQPNQPASPEHWGQPAERSGDPYSVAPPPQPQQPFASGYGELGPPPTMSGAPGVAPPPPGGYPPSPPTSGSAYFGQPASGAPLYQSGYSQGPSGQLPQRANRPLVVVTVVAVVLFLVAGLMTTFFILKAGDASDKSKALASTRSQMDKQKKDLDKIRNQLGLTKDQLSDSKDVADQLAEEKSEIKKCMTGLLNLNQIQDQGQKDQQLNALLPDCVGAFQALGIDLGSVSGG